MVSAFTKGRFGNFHYIVAAAYVYAMRHKLHFHSPTESLAPKIWPVYLQHLQNPSWDSSLDTVCINDDGHSYRNLPFHEEWRDKNIILGTKSVESGYFQSYKYSDGYYQLIRFMFGYRFFKEFGCVGIHVRRGDYLSYIDKHPPVSESYIIWAIEMIKRSNSRIYRYKFFSDDVPWCKEFYAHNHDLFTGYKVEFSEGKTEIEDFEELMNCQYMVISNSTFSSFAALLNAHEKKIVVCPSEQNWYGSGNSHLETKDMLHPSWIRIKY